jgi:hypothetical protein
MKLKEYCFINIITAGKKMIRARTRFVRWPHVIDTFYTTGVEASLATKKIRTIIFCKIIDDSLFFHV